MSDNEYPARKQSERRIKALTKGPMPKHTEHIIRKQSERAIKVIIVWIIIGVVGSVFYSSQAASVAQSLSIAAVALAVAGASLLVGGLLGFLFGIPRTLQHDSAIGSRQQADSTGQSADESVEYKANTNLEQISDWLTKILVGVGLTQLVTLPDSLQTYANFTAAGLGNFANSKVFSIAQLIFYLICGFLISYLWTRLYLAGAFHQADLDAIGGKLAQVEDKVSELEKEAGLDVEAWNVVRRLLYALPDSQPLSQEQLVVTIKSASPSERENLYVLAKRFVDESIGNAKGSEMERAARVFKALIASDTDDNAHHEYHGYLGIALSEQRHPNLTEAEAELTKAIEIRGTGEQVERGRWEFYRAICRIGQDDDCVQERKSDNSTLKENILTDLKEAAIYLGWKDYIISRDDRSKKWIKLNEIPSSEFDVQKS